MVVQFWNCNQLEHGRRAWDEAAADSFTSVHLAAGTSATFPRKTIIG
jgi:hypothetical protein